MCQTLWSDVSDQKEFLQFDCNMCFVCDCQSEMCDVLNVKQNGPVTCLMILMMRGWKRGRRRP